MVLKGSSSAASPLSVVLPPDQETRTGTTMFLKVAGTRERRYFSVVKPRALLPHLSTLTSPEFSLSAYSAFHLPTKTFPLRTLTDIQPAIAALQRRGRLRWARSTLESPLRLSSARVSARYKNQAPQATGVLDPEPLEAEEP